MTTRKLFAVVAATVLAGLNFAHAAAFDFVPVASTGVSTSQFTSPNGNGVINVSHSFSAGGAGGADNINTLIYPSQFTTLFPGTGLVQGHLAQTVYNHTSLVTFDLTGYTITPATVFGMWNTTDEVTPPVGGNFVYRLELIDVNGNPQVPSTFNLVGNQDNTTQVSGRHNMVLETSTGEIHPGASINGGSGIHTDAAFWNNIPTGTREIRVYGDLPALNNIGDGVGYYFVEPHTVPTPAAIAGGLTLLAGLAIKRRR